MPTTTPGGLPVPLDTDPVTDGAAAIRNLANALNPTRIVDVNVSGTASAGGSLAVTVPYGITLPKAPACVLGVVVGSAAGSGPLVFRRSDQETTTDCRITLLNGSSSAATVSDLTVRLVILL